MSLFILRYATSKPTLTKWLGRYYTTPRARLSAKDARALKFPPSEVLPEGSHWRALFPRQGAQNRYSLSNPTTASIIADKFVPKGSRDKVIIEAFPGPGALTRALLALPKERIKKLIVMEDNPGYLPWLRPLEKMDPRVVILPNSGYNWITYDEMKEQGLMDDVTKYPWGEGVHPQLQFVSHMPVDVLGEQLVAQFLRGIPDGQWLFQYGRVPMSFVLTDHVYQRLTTGFGADTINIRCKLTIVAEATAQVELAVEPSTLEPYAEHFHPSNLVKPFQAVNITPLDKPFIGKDLLEKWDFCLRRLYVLKGQPLKKVISSLAPGAANLVKVIDNPTLSPTKRLDTTKQIRNLTVREWQILVKAFDEWPFAPDDLQISDVLVAEKESQNRRLT